MTGTAWAEKNLYLTTEDAAEPGRYSTSRAPWQRDILDAMERGDYEVIVFMASAQVGKTLIMTSDILRTIDQDPCSILAVQPTLDMARTYSQDRFTSKVQASPALQGKIHFDNSKRRERGVSTWHKRFPGGQISFGTAGSTSAMKSRPVRRLYLDEINEYSRRVIEAAMKRTAAFEGDSLTFMSSTPTRTYGNIKGNIETWFEAGTQHTCLVPCPECGAYQELKDTQFRYQGKTPDTVSEVFYECEHCAKHIPESQKEWMIQNYRWEAKKPDAKILSFKIWQAYNLLNSWLKIVHDYLRVKDDPEALEEYFNQTLCKSWTEKTFLEWERLYDLSRHENLKVGTVPKNCSMLTAYCDVQKDWLEVEVKGWTRDLQSYSIDHFQIPGPAIEIGEGSVWKRLSEFLLKTYPREDGIHMPLAAFGIDSGYETHTVYWWARQQPAGKVYVTKGAKSFLAPAVVPAHPVDVNFRGQRIPNGVLLWSMGSSQIKQTLYSLLRLRPITGKDADGNETRMYPPRYMHFPQYDETFFMSLVAESVVEKKASARANRKSAEWVKHYERNEVLDINVGNYFLMNVVGMDRYTERDWEIVEGRLRPARKTVIASKKKRGGGRAISSGIDDD